MPKRVAPDEVERLVDAVRAHPGGVGVGGLLKGTMPTLGWSERTLKRRLTELVAQGRLRREGRSRATRYLATEQAPATVQPAVEQVVCELLNNACKYTLTGERIAIGLREAGNHLELTVANTGAEIPQAELLHIFEKFYRIPNCDPWRQGGTDLGLALVQRLTQRLGGQVRVKSEDRTTTFTVALPLDLGLDDRAPPECSLEAEVAGRR